MKFLRSILAVSFSILANAAMAEVTFNVDGEDLTLSQLMENCQSLADDPVAQIACFNAVSKLVEEQGEAEQAPVASVPETLDNLRAVAQHQTAETGFFVSGSDCRIQILYYNNYFHISRRNVSSIDLFSATFDASQLQYDQVAPMQGAQGPLVRGVMQTGAAAIARGGVALESSQYDFAPKSARTSIAAYAVEVANQLAVHEGQEFNFVLVHPDKSQSSAAIWNAFEAFVGACQS